MTAKITTSSIGNSPLLQEAPGVPTSTAPRAPRNSADREFGQTYSYPVRPGSRELEDRVWSKVGWRCAKHGRIRSQCKKCGSAAFCEHGRRRCECKECGGSSICEHMRRRCECKECGGASICTHGRLRRQCKQCGGAAFCEHDRRRSECKICGGASICEHKKLKYGCKECRALRLSGKAGPRSTARGKRAKAAGRTIKLEGGKSKKMVCPAVTGGRDGSDAICAILVGMSGAPPPLAAGSKDVVVAEVVDENDTVPTPLMPPPKPSSAHSADEFGFLSTLLPAISSTTSSTSYAKQVQEQDAQLQSGESQRKRGATQLTEAVAGKEPAAVEPRPKRTRRPAVLAQ